MNFDKMTTELAVLYAGIKNKTIDLATAHELNNTAANIQGVIRLGLLNAKMVGKTPDLSFFKKEQADE